MRAIAGTRYTLPYQNNLVRVGTSYSSNRPLYSLYSAYRLRPFGWHFYEAMMSMSRVLRWLFMAAVAGSWATVGTSGDALSGVKVRMHSVPPGLCGASRQQEQEVGFVSVDGSDGDGDTDSDSDNTGAKRDAGGIDAFYWFSAADGGAQQRSSDVTLRGPVPPRLAGGGDLGRHPRGRAPLGPG